MQIDELILKLKSDFNKVVSDANSLISKFTKLDNSTSKVSSDFENISKSASSMGNGFKASERNIESLENRLNYLKNTFNEHLSLYRQWGDLATTKTPESIKGLTGKEIKEASGEKITKDSLQAELDYINKLELEIEDLKSKITSVPKLKVIPKTDEEKQNLKDLKSQIEDLKKRIDELERKSKGKLKGGFFSGLGNILSGLKSKFKDTSKDISKGLDGNFKSLKKLGLGLIGVRTVMSLLTKSVNAYLSFDEQLQNSLNNSWNMLGSLLAPAIELVANLFATATNYVYRFVQALTGIDLVARANAKALQKQANATKGVANAQRGLLSMDEITNLPTEPGGSGSETPQITTKDIDTKGIFSDFLEALKQHKWHRAGEIIAEGINNGLRKIDWELVREKAESTGRNIADFLNGVFELDWRLLGSSIANAINTAIDFVYGFVTKLEWGRVGAGIGDAITSFFETFDFNKLADSISSFALGIMNMLRSALVHFDAEAFANTIVDFIERIKWGEIITNLAILIMTYFVKAFTVHFTLIGRLIGDLGKYLGPKLQKLGSEMGKSVAEAFKNGLKLVFNGLIWSINTMLLPVRTLIVGLGKVSGKNVSLSNVRIPYLATGTPNIETEGLYHLHEGEMVVPKKYNPNTDGYNNGADNKQIIDLLISLNASMIEYAERPININMGSKKVAEAIYDDTQEITRNKNYSSAVVRS